MSEKSTPERREKKGTSRTLDRRSYLKTVGATGGGFALGGVGLNETGIEPVQAAPTVLDDFEDGDIDEYTGHTSNYAVEQSSELEGSYRLKCSDPYDQLASTSTHGRGNRYSYRFIAGSGSGSKPGLMTCIQDGSNPVDSCYWLQPDVPNDKLILYLRESGSTTELASEYVSSGLSEGTEYRGVLELRSDTVKGILYDASGTQLVATSEIADTTYSDGHYGFYTGAGQPAYYDYVTKESLDGGDDGGSGSTSPNGPDIAGGGTVVDNFEDSDLEEYGVIEYNAEISQEHTLNGGYSLELPSDESKAISMNGLDNYPSAGCTFNTWIKVTDSVSFIYIFYGVQDPDSCYSRPSESYSINLTFEGNAAWIVKHREDCSSPQLDDVSVNLTRGEWYEVECEWGRNGNHQVTIFDSTGTQVAQLSGTDSEWKSGGIGFYRPNHYSGSFYIDGTYITEEDDSGAGIVVDDFEDGDLSEYDFDRGESGASIVSSPTVNGSNALEISGAETEMIKKTGLPNEPQAGDVFSYWVRATDGVDMVNLTYGVQDHTNRYFVRVNFENDNLRLYRYEDGTAYKLAEQLSGFSLNKDVWYEVKVDWRKNNLHIVELNLGHDRVQIKEPDPKWSSGGVGFDAYVGDGGTVYLDSIQKNQYITPDAGCVVDDFEDGDVSEYTVRNGNPSINTEHTYFGDNALALSGETELISTSGLPHYPEAGKRLRARIKPTSGASKFELAFGVDGQTPDTRYTVTLDFANDDVGLYYDDNGTRELLTKDETSCILAQDEWFRVEIDWKENGTQTVELYNDSNVKLTQISATDRRISNGGIGFKSQFSASEPAIYIDHVLKSSLGSKLNEYQQQYGPIQTVDLSDMSGNDGNPRKKQLYNFDDGSTEEIVLERTGENKIKRTHSGDTFWECIGPKSINQSENGRN